MTTDPITRRPQTDADEALLRSIYASTRAEEMAMVPWSDAQKAAFIDMQFRAQTTDYAQRYPDAQYLVLEQGGEPIGRLYVNRSSDSTSIIDIALLPFARRRGIGTALLRELLDEATAQGKPVMIHVERNNPALALYLRLGFTPVGESGIYYEMRRLPSSRPPPDLVA